MFVVDTRIKIASGDYSNQSLDYAINDSNGVIYKALGRRLEENESVMFEGLKEESDFELNGISLQQCPSAYVYNGTTFVEYTQNDTKYCMDGGYLVRSGNLGYSTPVNRVPGKILLPFSVEPGKIKMVRNDPGNASECLLMLCVNDDNPSLLEDRDGDAFANRNGFNDIPLLLNDGTGYSLLAWKQALHPAVSIDKDGYIVRNATDEEITIDFSVFQNVYRGKEIIFRLQSFNCTTPQDIYDFSTENWHSDDTTQRKKKQVSYSGSISRNPWRANGTDIITGSNKDIPTTEVVSSVTGKSYSINGRSGILVDYEKSTFGFEDNQDYNYIDFFGTQSDPKLEIIIKDRDKFGATGDRALAQGKNVLAQGEQSLAQGSFTHAVAEDAVAMGRWNEANPANIFEVGIGLNKKPQNGLSLSVDGVAKLPKQEDQIEAPDDIVVKGNLDTRIGTSVSRPATTGSVPTYDASGNLIEQKGLHAVSGEEYPYLQVNVDGSISAPCCKSADINYPDDLITKAYFDAHNSSSNDEPISLPISLNVSGQFTEWNGVYTWNVLGYYQKGVESQYIRQEGSVWVIGSTSNVRYTEGICHMTATYPNGAIQNWVTPANISVSVAITDAEGSTVSPTLDASKEISTSALVRSDNGYITNDRIIFQWNDVSKCGEIDVMDSCAGGFVFKVHNTETFLINTNGVLSAPAANNVDIAASPKALVTKEYADANYSGGGGGSMLTYGFSRISWAGNTAFGPNGSSDVHSDVSHLIFKSGTITQMSYYFEGHNTSGPITILVGGTAVYTSTNIGTTAYQNGLINNLNIPVTTGQTLSVLVGGGGQRGQITIVVEG